MDDFIDIGHFPDAPEPYYTPAIGADESFATSDTEGEAVWLRIGKAVEELLSEERPKGTEVHQGHR